MNKMQLAVFLKDIRQVLSSRMVILPMALVPAIIIVLMPVIILVAAYYGTTNVPVNGMDVLLRSIPPEAVHFTLKQKIIFMSVNFLFPAFFLIIPVMTSSIIGASSFVSEKEKKTLETLLYTPITIRELFAAKVAAVFTLSYSITLLSFILFGAVVNTGGMLFFQALIFPSLNWVILIAILSPAVTFLTVILMVIISAKAHTSQEAQQIVAFVVIPLVFLVVGQFTGLFLLNAWILLGTGAVTIILSIALLDRAAKSFTVEKLL